MFDILLIILMGVFAMTACFALFIRVPQWLQKNRSHLILSNRGRELDKVARLAWSQDGLGEY